MKKPIYEITNSREDTKLIKKYAQSFLNSIHFEVAMRLLKNNENYLINMGSSKKSIKRIFKMMKKILIAKKGTIIW